MGPRARYALAELGNGLRRNLIMTFATVLTVTVSLTLGGAGLLTQRQVDVASQLFFSQVEVAIFLQDGIDDAQVESLRGELEGNPEVENVLYESKEEAAAAFQDAFDDNEALAASITPEKMPASLRVRLVDPENFAVVASQYAGAPGVDVISDQRDVLDRLFGILNAFKVGGFAIAGLQLIGGAALIANVIRLSAYARREQIGIMKLVGATNWYIRLPFILEGVVAGLLGSIGAVLLLLVARSRLVAAIDEFVTFIPLVQTVDVFRIAPLLLLTGALVAALASFLSLRRFLEV